MPSFSSAQGRTEIGTIFDIRVLLLSVEGSNHAGLADLLAHGADLSAPLVERLATSLLPLSLYHVPYNDIVRLRLDERFQHTGETALRTRLQIRLQRIQGLQREVVLLLVHLFVKRRRSPKQGS